MFSPTCLGCRLLLCEGFDGFNLHSGLVRSPFKSNKRTKGLLEYAFSDSQVAGCATNAQNPQGKLCGCERPKSCFPNPDCLDSKNPAELLSCGCQPESAPMNSSSHRNHGSPEMRFMDCHGILLVPPKATSFPRGEVPTTSIPQTRALAPSGTPQDPGFLVGSERRKRCCAKDTRAKPSRSLSLAL